MQIINKFNRIGMALLSLAVMAGLAMSVHAEDQVELGEVVVTASRTEQEVKDTPAAVEVITREDLDKMGAKSLLDALYLSTSIQISPGMVGSAVSYPGHGKSALINISGRSAANF